MLSCKNDGIFPDMAIRISKIGNLFTGGELIELKDSDAYTVSSFNSTIPSRSKKITEIVVGESSGIGKQMKKNGDNPFSLPIRDVYYLTRGRKKEHTKVCLVYGSFFETINIGDLIQQSFSQVVEERAGEIDEKVSEEVKRAVISLFSKQQNFSRVRSVEKASVKLRFRIMTEVKAEGNILNSKKYPEIKDNTINLILPCHDAKQEKETLYKLDKVFGEELKSFSVFKIKHHFNGYFLAVQKAL